MPSPNTKVVSVVSPQPVKVTTHEMLFDVIRYNLHPVGPSGGELDGVIEGVGVIDGLGDLVGEGVRDGVEVTDGVTDGVFDTDGVIDGDAVGVVNGIILLSVFKRSFKLVISKLVRFAITLLDSYKHVITLFITCGAVFSLILT